MLKTTDILDEKNKILHKVSKEATFPLTDNDLKLIDEAYEYLRLSQDEEKAEELDLRPGMGLAFPQVGINKRIIVIVDEYEEGKFENYVVVNPVIVSNSSEMVAAEAGEGCLSVNREVEGQVLRYARVTVEGYDLEGNKIKIRAREDLSIAFQHEIDHLNGILFFDRIDKNKKFYSEKEVRLI